MPLTTTNFRYVGVGTFAAGSISGALDALYALGIATTYSGGGARTPGTGSAWTWAREQILGTTEAAYGAPPVNALNFRYIIGGSTAVRAYPFLTPETVTGINILNYGMARGAGVFTSWFNAQPFTTGFSGYWRGTRVFTTILFDRVYLWESQEQTVAVFVESATGVTSGIALGAWIDPMSTTSTTGGESDGRVYLMAGTGSTANMSATMWSEYFTGGATGIFTHGGGGNAAHCGVFNIGTTSIIPVARVLTPGGTAAFPPAWTSRSGEIPRLPMPMAQANSTFWGVLRSCWYTRDAVCGNVWRNAGADVGYIVGASTISAQDSCVLTY
jgi:hypothetical protein